MKLRKFHKLLFAICTACDTIFWWEGRGHKLREMINVFPLEGTAVKLYSRCLSVAQGPMRGGGSMFLVSQDSGPN